MQERGDERFAGAGGRVENDVLIVDQFENGFFLGGIGNEVLFFNVTEEGVQDFVRGGLLGFRKAAMEGKIHGDLCVLR